MGASIERQFRFARNWQPDGRKRRSVERQSQYNNPDLPDYGCADGHG